MSVVVNTVKVALSGVTVANGAGGGAGSFNGIPVLAVNHLDNFAPFKVNSSGHLVVDLGTTPLAVSDNGGSLTVDGSVTVGSALPAGSNNIGSITNITGSVTPGNAAANLGKAEDTAHNSGDTGVAVWGVRNDFGNSFSGSDGDYTPFNVDAQGRLRTLLYGYDSGAMDYYPIATTSGVVKVEATGSTLVTTQSSGPGLRVRSGLEASIYRRLSTASTNSALVASGNQLLHGYYISNTNSSVRYVKLYDNSSAPTVGTTTPVMTLAIPGNGAANVGFSVPVVFGNGLGIGITTGAADNDTGAVAANEVIVQLLYGMNL